MTTRFRTLLLAGAATLGMSGAAFAQVTVNGSPATINGVSQIVWNSLNISTGNPLPVAVVSGGGTGGGTSGPFYVGQYNTALPTFTTAQVGYVSLDVNGRLILAPSSSVSVSNFPATQAISAAALPLPAGAATSANQTSEIAALTAANQRANFATDFNGQAVAASGTAIGTVRDVGAAPSPYTWFSFNGSATVTGGTFYIQGSSDNFTGSIVTVATVPVAAASAVPNASNATPYTLSDRVRYRYYRVVYQNGATAGAISGASSMTVN